MAATTDNLKVLFSEEQLQTRIKSLAGEINDFYNGEEVVIVCVLKGAVMFMTDLAKYLTMPVLMEFLRLSSYGNGQKSSGIVKTIDSKLPDLSGKNILIVEDIIDTGLTAEYLIGLLKEKFSPKTVKFCSLLNKREMRKSNIQPDFYGFDIDNKFVVGYGLDDAGYCRNLPYIGYKEV